MDTYTWKILVFRGIDADTAVEQFNAWYGPYARRWNITHPDLRTLANEARYFFATPVPLIDSYEIHVLAYVKA